jgi:hypothetical protein
MTRSWWTRCAVTLPVAAALIGGCTAEDPGDNEVPLATGESLGEMRRQAAKALARYDAAAAAAGPSAPVDVEAPPWDPNNAPPGMSIEAAKGTPAGTRLTVTFTGAKDPATEPCGADYYAEAVESERAVVVIVIAQPHAADEICTLAGFARTATLNLARPLRERAVLEARQGQPVPVEPTLVTE